MVLKNIPLSAGAVKAGGFPSGFRVEAVDTIRRRRGRRRKSLFFFQKRFRQIYAAEELDHDAQFALMRWFHSEHPYLGWDLLETIVDFWRFDARRYLVEGGAE